MKQVVTKAASSTSSSSSSGLVKSLFRPAYADSGSNDTFRNDNDDDHNNTTNEKKPSTEIKKDNMNETTPSSLAPSVSNIKKNDNMNVTTSSSISDVYNDYDNNNITGIIENKSILPSTSSTISNDNNEQKKQSQNNHPPEKNIKDENNDVTEICEKIKVDDKDNLQVIIEQPTQEHYYPTQQKKKENNFNNNLKIHTEGSIIESTTASLTTINLNSSTVGILSMHKEEDNESINSTASVHGSEPTNTILDPNLISSKPCRSKRDGITEEMIQEIREEEEPLERWKEENKTNAIPRKKFGMFPMTTPNSDEVEAAAELKEDLELPLRDKSEFITPVNKPPIIRNTYSSPLARARQCFTPELREISHCRSYTSPPQKKQGVIPQSNSWEGVDFTPKTQTLQSNQRIHLQQRNPEHEDALDILSLLVERSLSMDNDKPALERSISNVHQLQEDLQTLRELSSKHPNHSSHMQTLDSLLASHTYALEMKRAAFSASTWLKSTQRDSEEKIQQLNEELSKCRAEIGRLKSKEEIFTSPTSRSILDNDDSSSAGSISEDLASLKEAMHENSNSMVNVQMLNSENFQTDWTELSPGLPPPPDHSLHSPIISSLLKQWTPDPNLHSSLLSWMEQVLHFSNTPPFPPLKITNMDHTIKEGFLMHLFPLLLRRSDVQIQVLTRAERKTTYDIGVTVTSAPILESKRMTTNSLQRMAFHASKEAADSTSLTSPISNSRSELTVFPSPEEPKKGFISSIHNSINTLLKPQPKPIQNAHPYHRVVSVPPGRIGVTFVDFRGHAMVSDVSSQSPLNGWVFPSDVLIAIDEVPVSGMRVKDIVKLLKGRMGRQRALRVISSRDMTELTNG